MSVEKKRSRTFRTTVVFKQTKKGKNPREDWKQQLFEKLGVSFTSTCQSFKQTADLDVVRGNVPCANIMWVFLFSKSCKAGRGLISVRKLRLCTYAAAASPRPHHYLHQGSVNKSCSSTLKKSISTLVNVLRFPVNRNSADHLIPLRYC